MDSIKNTIDLMIIGRGKMIQYIDESGVDGANYIPEKFNNNLIWNFGHVLATHQLLTYALSGLSTPMSPSLIDQYRKGTRPNGIVDKSQIDELKELSSNLIQQFETDYNNGVFKDYKKYQTSLGYELTNIERAIQMNTIHEGMHLGTCIDIVKFL